MDTKQNGFQRLRRRNASGKSTITLRKSVKRNGATSTATCPQGESGETMSLIERVKQIQKEVEEIVVYLESEDIFWQSKKFKKEK